MRGSITIFATMLFMLVSQFLFTVLEAGRNLTLTNIACMNSEAVAESVFAQYCRWLMRARCQETVLIHQPECPGEVCIKEQGAGPKVVMTGMRKYLCSSIF